MQSKKKQKLERLFTLGSSVSLSASEKVTSLSMKFDLSSLLGWELHKGVYPSAFPLELPSSNLLPSNVFQASPSNATAAKWLSFMMQIMINKIPAFNLNQNTQHNSSLQHLFGKPAPLTPLAKARSSPHCSLRSHHCSPPFADC